MSLSGPEDYEIEVRCADGLLTCRGSIDTGDEPPLGMSEDGWMFIDPDALRIRVAADGEIRVDGATIPLLPGVYRVTSDGLVAPDGVPLDALRPY